MSDISELIDILDDGGALHSIDISAVFGSKVVGIHSPAVSPIWVPFTG